MQLLSPSEIQANGLQGLMEREQSNPNSTVLVNGESVPLGTGVLSDILDSMGYSGRQGIAVAIDNRVVARTDWDSRVLNPGDSITLIRAAAGG